MKAIISQVALLMCFLQTISAEDVNVDEFDVEHDADDIKYAADITQARCIDDIKA